MGQWIAGSAFATALYHSDGNGNVTCLMYPNGTLAAKYLYDPFGNMLAEYGSLASANRYRFSSKEWDAASGLYYYLYRFYDPNLQRWPNRDPIEELGGLNLYEYVGNSPVDSFDPFGLKCKTFKDCWANCMKASGAPWALGALGVSYGTAATLPFKPGAGALGSGGVTTTLSLLEHYTGIAARQLGRRLNPIADVVAAGAAGYLAGLSGTCAALCGSNVNAF